VNPPAEGQRPNRVESLMRAPGDTPARADSLGGATEALGPLLARRTGLILVVFRDGQGDADTLAAILAEVMCGFEDPNPPVQIDIRDQPALAALYNVRTTPTILLMKDGEVVDRVVGMPTTVLVQSLLDARAPRAQRTARHDADPHPTKGHVRPPRSPPTLGSGGPHSAATAASTHER
jgi:thiol-disulfide isomerase/thioredoxin